MALVMRDGLPPFMSDENGHLSMRDGDAHWLVIVTREALEDAAAPAEPSLDSMLQSCALFGKVASFKLDHGRTGDDGTIWVQSDDVREWQFLQAK